MRERWPRVLAAGVIASLLFSPRLSRAQTGLGHLEDASTPPRGLLRLRAISSWTRYDSRFTATGVEPFGAPFTTDSFGVRQIPALGAIESAVQSASATPFTLSLGQSRLNAVAREVVMPLGLEYGLTDRLSIGVVVPVVHKRSTMVFLLDTLGANVGPNPQRTSSAAQQINIQVQAEFANAASQLLARLQSCQFNPAGPGCAALAGREAEAQQLIQASQAFASSVEALFGSATELGMAFVPRNLSDAHLAMVLRITDFNTRYRDLLAAGVDLLNAAPAGSGGPVGSAEFMEYFTDELGRDSLDTREQLGIGDVEIGFKFRLLDLPAGERRAVGIQASIASAVRLPTGSRQSPGELIDLRLGAGSVVIDSRAAIDARAWRLGLIAAAQLAMSVRDDPNVDPATYNTRSLELQLAPRWHVSDPFAVHAAYSVRSTDRFGGDQLVGGGVTFSTLSTYRAGAGVPMEMRFTHLESVSGDAGRPKFSRDQLEVRIYYRLRR